MKPSRVLIGLATWLVALLVSILIGGVAACETQPSTCPVSQE